MQRLHLGKKDTIRLLVGDVCIFMVALIASLFLRNGGMVEGEIVMRNISGFIPVFVLWIVGFFVYNLYGRLTVSMRKNLPATLLQACLFNTGVAVFVFYVFPVKGITPKTTLLLIFVLVYLLLYLWRVVLFPRISTRKPERVCIIGKTPEHEEIFHELNENHSLNVRASFLEHGDRARVKMLIEQEKIRVIVMDTRQEENMQLFSGIEPLKLLSVRFVNPSWLYEELFQRIPLSHITDAWLFAHVNYQYHLYDSIKRAIDIGISFPLAILSLLAYPFVWFAIKLEDGGQVFIHQIRVGRDSKPIKILKFRTMTGNDQGKYEGGKTKLVPTKVGLFLRKSRIDELPQLWNVLGGGLSLIGPRPELVPLVEHYTKEIPFYNVRHLIAPGLSGWAQINQDVRHPHHTTAVEETREKLSYDFYYLKHRSFLLDLVIMLRTIQIVLSRKGS